MYKIFRKNRRIVAFYLVLSMIAVLLVGCKPHEKSLDVTTLPTTAAPTAQPTMQETEPPEPQWPEKPHPNEDLFHVYSYSTLYYCWVTGNNGTAYWMEDDQQSRYYVDEFDPDIWLRSNYWLRVELTDAGRYYCNTSGELTINWLTDKVTNFTHGHCSPLSVYSWIPYYADGAHTILAGWILRGYTDTPCELEVIYTDTFGAYRKSSFISVSIPYTPGHRNAFNVEYLDEAPEASETSDPYTVAVTMCNGVYYMDNYKSVDVSNMFSWGDAWFFVEYEDWYINEVHKNERYMTVGYGTRPSFGVEMLSCRPVYADQSKFQQIGVLVAVWNLHEQFDRFYISLGWKENGRMYADTTVVVTNWDK